MRLWKKLKKVFTRELLNELDKVERNNTWKALLQLIHSFDGNELHMFIDYINELDHQKLKCICLPYMGEEYQKARKLAAGGDRKAVVSLTNHADKDTFFPDYIQFISSESPEVLKTHLINFMNGWFSFRLCYRCSNIFKSTIKKYETVAIFFTFHWRSDLLCSCI